MNILRDGNTLSLTSAESIDKILKAGIYDIGMTPRGYHLHARSEFQMPPKIYGGHDQFSTRVLKTYGALGHGMAILLSGPKGCGKTITAKQICMESKMPVLTMTAPFGGPDFVEFLTEMPGKCVVFIDEFEKLYREEEQRNQFLTLLDGACDNKHLFVMTSNKDNIGDYFANRPGRVRYHRKYQELPKDILFEMIDDKMPRGKLRTAVKELVEDMGGMSPDALVSLIQEVLIHKEVPAEFMAYFNVQNEIKGHFVVNVTTMGYTPKLGLSKKKLEEAKEFLESLSENSEAYALVYHKEGAAACNRVEETWTNEYSGAILRKFNRGQVRSDAWFYCPWMTKSGGSPKRTRTFQYQEHEIESVKREAGVIHILAKDGTKITCEPAKPLSGAY